MICIELNIKNKLIISVNNSAKIESINCELICSKSKDFTLSKCDDNYLAYTVQGPQGNYEKS